MEQESGQRVEAFIRYWNAYKDSYDRPGTLAWWEGYLLSEEFQDIRFHPQVVKLLADEVARQHSWRGLFQGVYMTEGMECLLWEAYGFQEKGETAYQGELQRLRGYLRPKRTKRRMDDKKKRILRGAAIILILLFSVWGALITNDGKAFSPMLIALFVYVRKLFEDMRE